MRAASPATVRFTVGLTGGIGSGKSTVAQMLCDAGADLVDTDRIARELTAVGGRAIEPLRAAFGDEAIDETGALDRPRMRERAFSDASVRARLEALLHPMIGEEARRRADGSRAAVVVFDVPLLVESGRWRRQVDRVLVVDCTEATQVERVVRRSGWTAQQARDVIRGQASRETRRAAADAVICNEVLSLDELRGEVMSVLASWGLAVAQAGTPRS